MRTAHKLAFSILMFTTVIGKAQTPEGEDPASQESMLSDSPVTVILNPFGIPGEPDEYTSSTDYGRIVDTVCRIEAARLTCWVSASSCQMARMSSSGIFFTSFLYLAPDGTFLQGLRGECYAPPVIEAGGGRYTIDTSQGILTLRYQYQLHIQAVRSGMKKSRKRRQEYVRSYGVEYKYRNKPTGEEGADARIQQIELLFLVPLDADDPAQVRRFDKGMHHDRSIEKDSPFVPYVRIEYEPEFPELFWSPGI